MANPLTGDYEAVVQIAARQINGLLGTLHQNGGLQNAALKLLHSVTLRIGDPPRRAPDLEVFGDWLLEYHRSRPGRGFRDFRAQVPTTAPPGAAKMLTDAIAGFDRDWVIEIPPDVVRGMARCQVASVTISVPPGSSTEITVHAQVRAHYYPDSGTTPLPAPIHGELRATFNVRRMRTHSGTRLLIQPSTDDSKYAFIAAPGTGLSEPEQSRLAAEVRKVIRDGLTLLPVDLPSNFPFSDFKGLGSGSNQVIALPLQLSGAGLPASGLGSLTQSFIGSSGFAFAVSKEHLSGLIAVEKIREAISRRRITVGIDLGWLGSVTATYTLRFSSGPTLTFKSGVIEISGRVEAETSTTLAPNGFIEFKVPVRFELDTSSQAVNIERAGEPDVDESWFIPHSRAVNEVRTQIDNALSTNRPAVRRVFSDAKTTLLRGLRTFDSASTATYTGVEITPNGIIVRGEVGSGPRRPPIVTVAETHGGQAFTAFQSWIAAGKIDRFVWSWVEHSGLHPTVWGGVVKTLTDAHRFILPKPQGITEISQICLRIEGTQVSPGGQTSGITAGRTCQIQEPEIFMDVPSWWEPVMLPIWHPVPPAAASLRESIAGHVSVQSATPVKELSSRNTLVYFVDWRIEKPLERLCAALNKVQDRSTLNVIVVVPAGAFNSSRREFEARLPKDRETAGAKIQFTEDDDGGWTRMFGVTSTPSVYLINAKREFVWKYEGEPDSATLVAEIDKLLVPAAAKGFRPLRLTALPGERAPNATFADDQDDRFALHRFEGRNVLLNFWQSWSAPCVAELTRLQRLYETEKGELFIVAFHGGKDGKALDEIRKRLNLSFPLVQDSHQRIARRFGVRCWPTTVMIGAEGHVEHVQFGTEHDDGYEPPRDREQSSPA